MNSFRALLEKLEGQLFYDKILKIKANNGCYVIAELGSNWKTTDDLMGAISLAKSCGADAIKYQYFTESELFGPVARIDKTFPLNHLSEKCKAVGIDFLCSAFSPDGVKELNKFVDAFKVASSEMSDLRLLEAIKATGKPIILSTGAYFIPDVERVLKFLSGSEVILMHCNVKYPARFTKYSKFLKLKELVEVVGFSDHTTSIEVIPVFYKEHGATVIEKHFNPFDYTDKPDWPVSLSAEEFKVMVSFLRGAGIDYDEESEARLLHARRVIALKDLAPGARLQEGENMGIFRPRKADARGMNPFAIDQLEGQAVTKMVSAGEGISLVDIR